MPLIKRYANRKLYDTAAKEYISLEGIAEMIRLGVEIQVIDNVSGDDITAQTLSQIILEGAKKQDGYVPRPILTTLVEAGGRSFGYLREKLEPHFKQISEIEIDEKIQQRIQGLIQRGEIAEETGKKILNQIRERAVAWNYAIPPDDALLKMLVEKALPNRSDVQKLLEEMDLLADKLDGLK